jgi:regulator of sigma E protease
VYVKRNNHYVYVSAPQEAWKYVVLDDAHKKPYIAPPEESIKQTVKTVKEVTRATGNLLTYQSPDQWGSVVAAIYLLSQITSWSNFLFIAGLISLSLGLINLLPVPPLDGSKIFFYKIRKKWPEQYYKVELAFYVGIVNLMLFLMAADIIRIVL